MIGLMSGAFVFATFGDCNTASGLARMLASAMWFFTTFGGYFNSERFAMLGKMAALFGGRYLVDKCNSETNHVSVTDISQGLVDVVICMVVTTLYSLLLHNQRPSAMAHADLCRILQDLRNIYGQFYNDPSPASLVPASLDRIVCTGRMIESEIGKVQCLSVDAVQEIRFWRPKWRHAACQDLAWTCHHVATQVDAITKALRRCKSAEQAAFLSECLRSDALKALIALSMNGLLALEHVASILVADDQPAFVACQTVLTDDDVLENLKTVSKCIDTAIEAAASAFQNSRFERDQDVVLLALLQIVDSLGLSCRLTYFCRMRAVSRCD
jgi:hypothetical protein